LEVKLIAYTPNAEELCAKAMRSCRTIESSSELTLTKPVGYYIDLALKFGHLSVLEHASFTFSVKDVSRVCTHQLVRHRIASYSQQSFRHVIPQAFKVPRTIDRNEGLAEKYRLLISMLFECYKRMLEADIPREDARYILPMSTLTNITVTMNARELLHFFSLRLSKEAHWEIRELAKRMLEEVKKVCPNIFKNVKCYNE